MDGHDASVAIGGPVLDVANLLGKAETLAIDYLSARPRLIVLRPTFFLSIEYSAWTWNGSSSCSRISYPWFITALTASSFTGT
jgi:hypothetical protein